MAAFSRARLATILSIILICFALIACQSRQPNEIELGAVLPLTGDIASYGIAAQRGIDLAVAEINDAGGVDGAVVSVVYEDDQGKATQAVSALRKLISVDQVPLVFGSAASSVTIAMCPIANEEAVVLISPISSSKELTTEGGPYFFRVCPSDVVQAKMMAEWIWNEGSTSTAVVFVNNSWGQGLRDEFVESYESLGGSIPVMEAVRESDRNLRAQLTRVKAANPQAIYAITYGREGGALLRQATEMGVDVPFYGADVWGSPELAETAGDAADGVKIIVPTKFSGDDYDAFAAAFEAKYGEAPDIYASYSYDMMHLVARALADGKQGDALRTALRNTEYHGVTGATRFDENGDVVGKGFERTVLD